MKKLLTTIVLAICSLTITAQTNWQKGGNNNFSAPPGLPPTIGTDITWNSPLNFVTRGVQRMTILGGLPGGATTGFVGIGLGFTPNFLLDVNGGDININTLNRGYRIASNYVLWHNGIASNIYVGVNAGSALSTGIQNTFVGSGAGNQNTNANANAFFGYNAGTNTTTGSQTLS